MIQLLERVLGVNLYSVLLMTKTFLPHLLERPEGHIVNVSSMGGFFPVPGQTVYSASKAAVKLLAEGLYAECRETSVHVTTILPGAVSTRIAEHSGVPTEMEDSYRGDENGEPAASRNFPTTTPEDAAKKIIDGMEGDEFQVYVGMDAALGSIRAGRLDSSIAA